MFSTEDLKTAIGATVIARRNAAARLREAGNPRDPFRALPGMEQQILGAQKVAEEQSKPLNDNVAKLEREIKSFVTDHRDEMGKTKSMVLTFGEVGFRLSTSVSLPRAKEKLEEIIRRLKSRQMTDCIVVEEKVSKEALKKYGEDTVNAVGATWKQSDVFGYEVNIAKLEQIKAGN